MLKSTAFLTFHPPGFGSAQKVIIFIKKNTIKSLKLVFITRKKFVKFKFVNLLERSLKRPTVVP